MKAKLFACLFVALIALFLVISCDPKAAEPSETTYSTPTIKGTVSIPEGRNISPSEIYVKVIDEEGKTVSIPKAKSDGSFVVENLIAGRKYSILFTSVEPEFTNRGISRGNESTSGVGGWLQDIVPTVVGANDIGNVKLKPLGTIRGKAETEGNTEHYDTTVYIPGTSFIAMTDKDGFFSIYNVPEGTYTLRYTHEGCIPVMKDDVFLSCPDGEENPEVTVGEVTLRSDKGSVVGRVTFDGENDHTGINILLESEGSSVSMNGLTSEDGTFVIGDVKPGKYRILVSSSGYLPVYSSYFYVEAATTVTVPESIILFRNIGTIQGSVILSEERSDYSGISISIVGNGTSYSTVTSQDGTFVKIVKPGTYTVTASYPGYTSQSVEITVSENSTSTLTFPPLPLSSGAVAGFVFLSGSEDYSGVTVSLTNSGSMTSSLVETSASDGSFRFSNITESGTYLLTYSKDGYVSDNTKSIDVTVGSVANAGTVTLRSTFATVKGVVQLEGASSHENITILLRNDSKQYTATTDQKGEYLINRIIPGTYSILASKDGYVTSTPSEVVVEPSSDKTIETRTLSVAIRSVTGKVTLELLSDYSGALVTATNLSDNTLVYSAITNSEGNFTLAGMTPGEYSVVISCNGYRTVTLPTINIVSSSTTDLPEKNMLINRGTVSGTVNLEGRSSSEGIKVELMRGSEVYESTTTDETGSYSFYVPQGNYSGVRYSKTDFASSSISRNIALFADNYVSMGDTDLKATHNTVSGKVDVLTTNNEGDVTISFDGMESITAYTTTEDGEFSFEHVPVAKYVMRFRRTDCSDITVPVNVTAADGISLGTVTITPNSATIKGTVVLKEGLSSEGVTVSIDMGGKTLQTTTDSSGRYEIGGVSIADEYTVTYSKYGWDSNTQTISPKLDLLEIREMPEISLVDTTAPVLKSVTINNGTNTTADRNVVLHIDAEEAGSGIKTMLVYDYSNPQYLGNYSSLADWTFESSNGLKTVCVKVIDRAGNESDIISAQVTLTDQKKEVKGVLKGDDLTWTKEMSPYLVTGNLLVEKDDTLIIQPGVDVQFSGNYYLQVEGKLSAIGTKDERIKIYGIDSGDNNWDGMKFINDNDSFISYTNIDGLKNGIVGYCDIDHANITSNGWAIGSASFETKENVLNGYLSYCTILGNIAAMNTSVFRNNLIGNDVFLYSTQILENSFNCINLLTRKSFSYNNTFSKVNVYSKKDVQKNNTFNSCNLFLGYDRYNNMEHSVLYNIQFNNCTFEMFAADINNSNIINCSPILIESDRTIKERFDCTGNYWGDINTVEIKSKGEGQNLSFIIDYYDDFNRTRIDYSGYKESEVEDVGYHGQEPDGPYSGYSIGDTGPAGGVVFYDKGYYSDGWRYLEASKTDIGRYVFGYYRPDGTSNNEVGTLQVIGSGKYNTERLVELMDIDGKAYSSFSGTATAEYAAKKCLDYSYGGYDDWFLPSKEELKLMYKNLSEKGLGSFANNDYWSSSEYSYSDAWTQCFSAGYQNNYGRYSDYCVRAVRAF